MIGFFLLLWGLTYLLTSSAIFMFVRRPLVRRAPLFAFLYCPPCAGFWIGLVLALSGAWPLEPIVHASLLEVEAAVCSSGVLAVCAEYIPNKAWDIEQGAQDDSETTQ